MFGYSAAGLKISIKECWVSSLQLHHESKHSKLLLTGIAPVSTLAVAIRLMWVSLIEGLRRHEVHCLVRHLLFVLLLLTSLPVSVDGVRASPDDGVGAAE
jgi:hypothetical protein